MVRNGDQRGFHVPSPDGKKSKRGQLKFAGKIGRVREVDKVPIEPGITAGQFQLLGKHLLDLCCHHPSRNGVWAF